MQAIRVHRFGGPEELRLDEVPALVPGPGELLIRVHAVGVNPVESYQRSGAYAYRDRRNRKRDFRRLWIIRINAAARREGMSYSEFMSGLREAGIEVNRKMLAELAVNDADAFRRFVELAREGAAA